MTAALRFSRQMSLSAMRVGSVKNKVDNTYLIQITKSDDDKEDDKEDKGELMKVVFQKGATLHELFNIQVKNVYIYALKVFFEVEELNPRQENDIIFKYIQQLFDIDDDSFQPLAIEAKKLVAKENSFILKCTILRASDITEKSRGKSNSYCTLCILDKRHIESRLVRNHNIKDWVENNIVSGDMVIKTTVKQETLNPEWNESFDLNINDYKAQYLVIELWHAEARSKVTQNPIQYVSRDQDFLGRTFYPIQNVPVGGIEGTLALLSHSAKHTKGTLTVWMNIIGQKEDKTTQQLLSEYKELLQSIVMKETCIKREASAEGGQPTDKDKPKDLEEHVKQWDGRISENGEKLLSQCASLHRISALQEAVVRLSVLIEYNKVYAVKITALGIVLQSIIANSDESLKILKESSSSGTVVIPLWVEKHIEDLKELSTYILDIMKQHLHIFNFKVLRDLYQVELFKSYLANEQMDISSVLSNAIQVAVGQWMLIISANFMPEYSSNESSMIALKGLCAQCLKQCQIGYDKIHPVFQEVGVDYFSPFFMTLAKLLCKELECRLGRGNTETALLTFEIYTIIRELCKFQDKVDPEFISKNKLKTYSPVELFKVFVADWIKLAQEKAKGKIKKAIELDTIVKISDEATFSSSAVDANAIFLQVITFWKDLKWPDRGQSIGFLMQIMESLENISVYYADELFAKANMEHQLDDEGHLIVSDQVCVALNNIHHVREVLENIDNELDLLAYYKWLDEEKPVEGPLLSQHASTLLSTIKKLINDVLWNKVNVIAAIVIDELCPHVLQFVAMISSTDVNVAPDKILEPMINYISGNVGKLSKVLLTPVLLHILSKLWLKIVLTLREEYEKVPHTTQNPLLSRFNYALLNLAEFFEAGGGGLKRSDIESKEFLALKNELYLSVLGTKEVIKIFNTDLVKQQANSKALYGTLHMSHKYDKGKKVLIIEIVSAENIPALDLSGKSDPYIQLFLLPTTSFPAASENVYKTSVKKQTLDPLFKETIEIPADSSAMKQEGAILLMATFDYDVITSDDFAGFCIVPCNSVSLDGKEPKITHLNLLHFQETNSHRELSLRHSDQEALKLVKTFKKFR